MIHRKREREGWIVIETQKKALHHTQDTLPMTEAEPCHIPQTDKKKPGTRNRSANAALKRASSVAFWAFLF